MHIFIIVVMHENQDLSLLLRANFPYLRPLEDNHCEAAFAKTFQPDQVCRFNYKIAEFHRIEEHAQLHLGCYWQNPNCGKLFRTKKPVLHANKLQGQEKELEEDL